MGLAPLLLIIEDVHWADGGTLALLRHLGRTAYAQRAPLLLVLTYREEEMVGTHALNDMLHDFNREHLADRIKLGRLGKSTTGELLEAIFSEQPSDEFTQGIYRETEGNPFYVEEVCRALTEEGKLYRVDGRWQRAEMSEIEIPHSIRMAVQSRVGKLPEPTQEVLQLAAVLGREFDAAVLGQVAGMGEDSLIECLEQAERAQLISEVHRVFPSGASGRVTYSFAHALIPSALSEGMSSLRRGRSHRRAAQALELLYPAERLSRELAPQLGRHYSEAGDPERAAEYWLAAGARSREVYAYSEAANYLERALAALKEHAASNLDQAARTAMKLGMLYHTLFDYPRARLAFQQAFNLWQQAESLPPQSLPPAPHPYRSYLPADVETLDPAMASDLYSIECVEQLFAGLVELNVDMDIVPSLARSWEISPNGCEYRFKLRSDARWTDNQPVTARDFEYAWKRVLEPRQNAPFAEMLLDIVGARDYHEGRAANADAVGVHALDDTTLLVELCEPVGHFLFLLAVDVAFAVPSHTVERWGEAWTLPEHIVSNGPFYLGDWQPGVRMTLDRNPYFFGRFTGNLTRLELYLSKDFDSESLAWYAADRLDVAELNSEIQHEYGRANYPSELINSSASMTIYLAFDTSRAPFDDRRVRQALVRVVDRDALANGGLQGFVTAAEGGLVPPGTPGYSPGIGLPYDPDTARRLLAEAGFPKGEGFPQIEAVSTPCALGSMQEYISEGWRRQLGINIQWQMLSWLEYRARISRQSPQILTLGWSADYPDPETFLGVAMHQSFCTWHNPQFEQYLKQARRLPDEVERARFYQAADRLLMEEAAICPLCYKQAHLLIKPWVERFPVSATRNDFWCDVVINPH
ncbi:MAG: ABC transporter substrate-binding protein [Anaerolineae bacterium]